MLKALYGGYAHGDKLQPRVQKFYQNKISIKLMTNQTK
jgi:hypothetical protein